MKSNSALPCALSSAAHSGAPARAAPVLRDQPLQKPAHILAGNPDQCAIDKGGRACAPVKGSREWNAASGPDRLTIRRPDDWHVHLRDGDMLRAVAPYTARQFARAIVMPNLAPPVTSVAAAGAYRDRILAALPTGCDFTPLMTCYLTDDADPAEIARGHARGRVRGCQALSGERDDQFGARRHRHPQHLPGARAMQRDRHAVAGPRRSDRSATSTFSTARRCSSSACWPALCATFPALKIVFEHITTAEAADFVAAAGPTVAATITPQHLIINRNAMFDGGIRPHAYCLPVAKRERHRLAVRARGGVGLAQILPRHRQRAARRRARRRPLAAAPGIFNAPFALESYATVFEEEGALDRFEAFASEHGRALLRPAAERGDGDAGARRRRSAGDDRGGRCRSTRARRCGGGSSPLSSSFPRKREPSHAGAPRQSRVVGRA